MADVYAIFGTLLALGISFPGMLTAWHLIFPTKVERAREKLQRTPWGAFWMGIGVTILAAFPITILLALPLGPAKLLGVLLILISLAVTNLGAAGLAAGMASRLSGHSSDEETTTAEFVKAAIALELAAAFPFIGWFLVLPIVIITSLGAASFALLGWGIKRKTYAIEEAALVGAPAFPADTSAS